MEKGSLGKAIKKKRKTLGITAEQLAKDVGVVRTYISKIENKAALPSEKLLYKIEKRLGTDLKLLYAAEKMPLFFGLDPSTWQVRRTSKPLPARPKEKDKKTALFDIVFDYLVSVAMYKRLSNFDQEIIPFLEKFVPDKVKDKKLLSLLLKEMGELSKEYKKYWEKMLEKVAKLTELICSK